MKIEVKKEKMTRTIIEKIIQLDKDFYTNFDYSDTSWYYSKYNKNNEVTVLKVDYKIAGYYLFFNITRKLLNDILDLKYSGDYNFPNEEINQNTGIAYWSSVLVKEEYRQYSMPLLKQLIVDVNAKKEVVAIAVSNEGKRMCEKYMKYVGSPKVNIGVYYKRENK